MLTSLLWVILPLGQPPTPPPAKPASAEIVISGRPIQIPPLPSNVQQARAEHQQIKLQLLQTREDLEAHLRDLQRALQGTSCPTSIKVPKGGGADIRFLLSVLKDEPYETLEESFLKTWDEWQSLLINKGLAARTDGSNVAASVPAKAEDMPDHEETRVERSRRNTVFGHSNLDSFCRMSATVNRTGGREGTDWTEYARLLEQKVHYEDRVSTARQLTAVANKMAPNLLQAWTPLVDHLNQCARRLADMEQSPSGQESADQKMLRLYANQAYLERVRLANWLCSVVWAEMTSEAFPPPLKPLT